MDFNPAVGASRAKGEEVAGEVRNPGGEQGATTADDANQALGELIAVTSLRDDADESEDRSPSALDNIELYIDHLEMPKRVKKKFVEQKRAETAGTTQ